METQPLSDRIITADASKVSPREFLRAVIGDVNDITAYPRVGKYFLRGGAWWLVKPEHYTREQLPCPGHVASDGDPKVCRHCGTHVDEYRDDAEAA